MHPTPGQLLQTASHQLFLLALLGAVGSLMVISPTETVAPCLGSQDPAHSQSCTVCQSSYRFARD
jgi:hypothetical protein